MEFNKSLVLATVVATGCSTLASRDDFTAFRAYRYESSADRRTQLGADYLERFPQGRFRAQVEADVRGREEEFWDQRRATLEGLQAYLDAFPNGQFAAQARQRIAAYEAERQEQLRRQREREEEDRRRREAERQAIAERQRMFVRNQMLFWLRTFGGINAWGEPLRVLAPQNPEFNNAFGAQPAPQCGAQRCRKLYHVDFFVPVPGRSALPRSLDFALDLMLGEGRRVYQTRLVLQRRGLSSWFECETAGMSDPNDPEQRQRSIQWAMDQLRGIIATAFPDARETPPELVGPEPEPEGELAADPAEQQEVSAAQSPIPPQPLGTQFSYIVGCGALGGARISVPEGARPQGWTEASSEPAPVRACLRIDAYAAPDAEGISQDEGLRISFIPPSALQAPASRTARPPRRGGRGNR